MRQCSNCGAPLDDDALFCTSCGTKLKAGKRCIHCGVPIDNDSLFCTSCGGKQDTSQTAFVTQPQQTTPIQPHRKQETEVVSGNDAKRKQYIIIACAVLTVLLCVGGWFAFFGSSDNNPLGIDKPKWEKFIVTTSQDVPLHKEARSDSPHLMEALENLESDMATREFRWEDQGKKRGYTICPYNLEKNNVLPVIDETDTWYKVQVYDGIGGMTETAYIQKKWTREIKPEPITEEVLARVSGNQQRFDHIVKNGKLKNLILTTQYNEMDGENLQIGALIDGVLIYPQYKQIFLRQDGVSGFNFQKNEEYDNYILIYGEDYQTNINDYSKVFDPQKLTDEKVSQIFESINQVNPSAVIEFYYYFPKANQDCFFKFTYIAGQNIINAPTTNNDAEETKVTGYHAEDRGDGQVLFAEFGSAKEDPGVDFLGPLIEVADLDGDENMDAFVQNGLPGSSGIYNYSVVYFDEMSDKFKTAEDDIETLSDSPTIVDWENRKCIVVSDGIQIDRYVLEPPKLKVIKSEKGDVGKIVKQISIDELFDMVEHNTEPVEREISADINGDGIYETLVFSHGDAHAYAFGDYMGLERIRWADGSFTDEFGALYTGDKFAFLQNKTNGLPDILVRELYLFRWSGSVYERWNWNGTKFEKTNEQ